MRTLAEMYRYGRGVNVDGAEAVHWYEKILEVEPKNTFASFELAKIYSTGEGVPRDVEKGFDRLKMSAENGSYAAQIKIAEIYLQGGIFPRDESTALYWYEQALKNVPPDIRSEIDVMRKIAYIFTGRAVIMSVTKKEPPNCTLRRRNWRTN